MEELKKYVFGIPTMMYKQLVDMQFDIFKREKKRVSIAFLMREALQQYLDKKN